MNTRKSKFVPVPRHFADTLAQQQMAQALNAILNGQVVVGSKADLHLSDGNMVIELPPTTVALATFQMVSDGGDYYNCYTFDGVNVGTQIVKVAKNQDQRCILPTATPAGGAWASKVIREVTYTYTYVPVDVPTTDGVNVVEYFRAVSGSDGSSEVDVVTPCLNVGDILSAFPTSFAGPDTLMDVKYQALTDGRAWAASQ